LLISPFSLSPIDACCCFFAFASDASRLRFLRRHADIADDMLPLMRAADALF